LRTLHPRAADPFFARIDLLPVRIIGSGQQFSKVSTIAGPPLLRLSCDWNLDGRV